jgi:hypothetical protein
MKKIIVTFLIKLGIIQDPMLRKKKLLQELITWATAPVPEQEATYVILQPAKQGYPYKVQFKPGITKIDSAHYEIKAYARDKDEAEKKEAVFMKLWLDNAPVLDKDEY